MDPLVLLSTRYIFQKGTRHYSKLPLSERFAGIGNHPIVPLFERALFVISLSMCCHNDLQGKEVSSCQSLTYPR